MFGRTLSFASLAALLTAPVFGQSPVQHSSEHHYRVVKVVDVVFGKRGGVAAPTTFFHPSLQPWTNDRVRQYEHSPTKVRQVLLTAFEAAYEKAQSAAGHLSQVSDPLEVAMYSFGFHQISVSLCRARVILLMAELESNATGDGAGH